MPTAEETVINVNLQPLRLNIDQETLFFIIDFCSAFLPKSADSSLQFDKQDQEGHQGRSGLDKPIKYTPGMEDIQLPEVEELAIEANENVLEDDEGMQIFFNANVHGTRKEGELYIRSFTFARDVPIRIDYSAKFVDLAHGAIPGILAGLTSLNCSELTLKKVHYRNGISGVDKLVTLLVTDWLTDIRQNQIPGTCSCPMSSLPDPNHLFFNNVI